MNVINPTLNNATATAPPVTTTNSATSRDVRLSTEVRNEQNARTEISRRTTTETTTETSTTRTLLESQIKSLNKKLDELGQDESKFQLSDDEQPTVQLVDLQAGRSMDLQKNVEDFLASPATEQSGLVLDTVT